MDKGGGWTAPPLHPAFPEPQPGRAPQASLSDEVSANVVFELSFFYLCYHEEGVRPLT